MSGAYERWITQLRKAWMGPVARAILGGWAAGSADRDVAWVRAAQDEHLPERASADALPLLASERRIEFGPGQPLGVQQQVLMRAVQLHQLAGTALGLLIALYYADFPGAVLVQQNGAAATLTDTPDLDTPTSVLSVDLAANPQQGGHPWWTFDLDDAFCSRFGVIVMAPDDPGLGIQANVDRFRRVIAQWKPAKATCVGAWYVAAGRVLGWPVRQLGPGNGVLGGATVTFYPF